MGTKIFDPVTGDRLAVYCFNISANEVYPANNDKAIASISSHLNITREEVINKLAMSDIDNPINIGDEEFWTE